MAEGALFIVAEGIIGQLGNQALKEFGLIWGVKEELQKLEDTVSTIKAVILDAEEKQAQNHTIKNWLGRLKDALFEADDLLDDFSTEVLRREVMTRNKKAKEVRVFFSKSNQLAYGLKMGHKIQAIRERLDAIAEDRKKFHLDERPRETQVTNPIRETDYFVRAETVIGREFDKKVILERLLDSNIEENVSVYSIVGIGGLGKTTLAQLVFNDEEIKKEFEREFWVCVSDDFDVNIIVKKILEYAKGKKLENLERNASINDLQKEIDGKRFLLVLDDVWNDDIEKWDRLKEILLGGARGSRILVTTREEKVAESSKTIETHRLTGLNDGDSWSLFKQKAFKKGQEQENSKFKEIGMEIISKCKGVPIAIKTIGSLLYSKKSEEEWLSFKNNEFSKVNESDILPTLRLSYDHLPSHLKQCFAYCSLFPKDYEFEKEELIKLWMAQGFIRLSGQNQCLEDVGHKYFMELLWRSFFQKDRRSIFKIHDLMHDLAILVAGLESTTFEINGKRIEEKTYHVSFGFDLGSSKQIPNSLFKASRIRTFLLPSQTYDPNQMVWNKSTCDAFVSSFKFLRLLDLNRTGIRSVPHSIGKLKHLRHLDLSLNGIKMLPNSITRLQNLEILNLYNCDELVELPRNISRLVNLRHLITVRCYRLTHMPRGLGQLTNLQSLAEYVLSTDSKSGSGLKELHGLNQLRKNLRIKNLRHKKDAELEYKSCLKEKQHLKGLVLEWIEREVDVEYDEMSVEALEPNQNLKSLELKSYRGVKYPSWLSSLKNLVRLKLDSLKNSQDVLPLHQFPSLKTLYLKDIPSLEYVTESFKLPPLKSLEIWNCPNLKGWWRRSDSIEEDEDDADNYGEISTITAKNYSLPSFCHLSTLDIFGCPKLSSMPLFPYLEKLKLRNSNLRPLERTISMGMINTTSQQNPTTTAVAESTSSARSYSSSTLAASFTPLSKLKYLNIGMIEGSDGHVLQSIHLTALEEFWLYNYNGDGMELEWLQQATSLRNLNIYICPSLTTLTEWICEIISLQSLSIYGCPNFTSLPALTSLQSLSISGSPNFTSLPALTSLQSFSIYGCPNFNFTSLPALTSLQSFSIYGCPNFTSLPALTSLKSLSISGCPNFTSLPALTSLQSLDISGCPNFTSLPALTSLQSLHIFDCPNFTSLPALTSLKTLDIRRCPILVESCKSQDWVARIENLRGDLAPPKEEDPEQSRGFTKFFGRCSGSTSQ
ncbi:putative disease resistance protein RGA4 [Quercus robur]|uniref:putative disease resistance protein RGA4 n=1 Tax=Quercus robur TaxID=38942 RepID=UPI0021635D1D|nr:putative disease resistance protein RGA4 [Quercus robur]XP_050283735.1 putative disease resistance protein RGA4 [Quercus robur]XP_050283736.1 putative disease resistance protein RGA4 [Quercus robur]XP_050283737.1 putative disease resistance protein RGA4 [Quercus robur]XP_050283739.1 putative disease resistance protein RGA4 [Quercus robur]XP_050283740.1 putative disease resistance protein RGA4 [Quercus robur]XP_050283741.1 putative disease resistance protein RGA4 [Quercus robur]XP_05028374